VTRTETGISTVIKTVNLTVILDTSVSQRHTVRFAGRRTVDHGNTQRKSVKKLRTIIRAALMTVLKDDLMTTLKNALGSIPLNTKERIRIQRILIRSLKLLL
jgi:hypothetical protein